MTETEMVSEIFRHIEVINSELGDIASRVAVLETQVASVLWLQKLVLSAIIIAVFGSLLNLILKKKNSK